MWAIGAWGWGMGRHDYIQPEIIVDDFNRDPTHARARAHPPTHKQEYTMLRKFAII